jgi:hypothetical protein
VSDVNSWFESRGFEVRQSAVDYARKARESPGGQSLGADGQTWVDLWTLDGRMIHPAYGAGPSLGAAAERARQRWLIEQEGPDPTADVGAD